MPSKHRTFKPETRFTRLIGARVPHQLYGRLANYAAYTGQTTTEIVNTALQEYLAQHSPIEAGREEVGD